MAVNLPRKGSWVNLPRKGGKADFSRRRARWWLSARTITIGLTTRPLTPASSSSEPLVWPWGLVLSLLRRLRLTRRRRYDDLGGRVDNVYRDHKPIFTLEFNPDANSIHVSPGPQPSSGSDSSSPDGNPPSWAQLARRCSHCRTGSLVVRNHGFCAAECLPEACCPGCRSEAATLREATGLQPQHQFQQNAVVVRDSGAFPNPPATLFW